PDLPGCEEISVWSLVVAVLMTWAPFLVSNFSRIASVRAALDRRRFLTVNPGRTLFCDLLPSPGTGARPERVGQATNKSFCVRSKTRRANVARQRSETAHSFADISQRPNSAMGHQRREERRLKGYRNGPVSAHDGMWKCDALRKRIGL